MFNPCSRRTAEHWGYLLPFRGTPVHSHYPHQVVHNPLELQLQMIQHPLFFWPPTRIPNIHRLMCEIENNLRTEPFAFPVMRVHVSSTQFSIRLLFFPFYMYMQSLCSTTEVYALVPLYMYMYMGAYILHKWFGCNITDVTNLTF